MTSIFDRWTDLDPALALRRIEAAHGSAIFDRDSYTDPQRALRQIETALGIELDDVLGLQSPSSIEAAIDAALADTGGGGGSYVQKLVRFPAGTNFLRQSTGNLSDVSTMLLSFWHRTDDISIAPDIATFLAPDGAGFSDAQEMEIGYNIASDIGQQVRSATSRFRLGTVDGLFTLGQLHSIVMSVDTAHDAGQKIGQLYFDGVSVTDPSAALDGDPSFLMAMTGAEFAITHDLNNPGVRDYADVQCWIGGPFVDLSDPANLAKFIVAGMPVDPAIASAAFGQPSILLSGDATTFQVNQGTGPAFALTGTITDAP